MRVCLEKTLERCTLHWVFRMYIYYSALGANELMYIIRIFNDTGIITFLSYSQYFFSPSHACQIFKRKNVRAFTCIIVITTLHLRLFPASGFSQFVPMVILRCQHCWRVAPPYFLHHDIPSHARRVLLKQGTRHAGCRKPENRSHHFASHRTPKVATKYVARNGPMESLTSRYDSTFSCPLLRTISWDFVSQFNLHPPAPSLRRDPKGIVLCLNECENGSCGGGFVAGVLVTLFYHVKNIGMVWLTAVDTCL